MGFRSLKIFMKSPAFREEYEKIEPELAISRAIVSYRIWHRLTMEEFAERCNLTEKDIRRIEEENSDTTIEKLRKVAEGMGMRVKISFEVKED
jgi:transcriptional regulator with XRE-family HTH domain